MKKRLWVKIFIKYLIAFFAVFVSSAMIYVTALRGLEKEELGKFDTQVKQGVIDIEDMIKRMNLVGDIIKQNQDFQSVLTNKGELENARTMSLLRTRELMTELCMATDVVYMFVLFEDNDVYISNVSCDAKFEDYYDAFLDIQAKQFALDNARSVKETFLEMSDISKFIPLEKFIYMDSSRKRQIENAILYLVKGGNERFGKYVMGYIIDSVELQKILGGYHYQDIEYCITESLTGKVFMNCAANCDIKESVKSYVVTNCENSMGWNIEVRIYMSMIHEILKGTSRLLSSYLVIGIMIVIGGAIIWGRHSYKGVNSILRELPEEKQEIVDKENINKESFLGKIIRESFREDEYSVLADAIKKQNARGDVWKRNLKEMEFQNRMLVLSHVLVKGIDEQKQKEILVHCFGESLEFYCVVIVRTVLYNNGSREELIFNFVRMLNERMTDAFIHLQVGKDDEVFLISIKTSLESNVNRIEKIFGECLELLIEKIDGTVHVGISRIGSGIESIYQRYEQACQIVQSLAVYEDISLVRVFNYDDIAVVENLVNVDFLNRLNNDLLCGKKEKVMEAIGQLYNTSIRNPVLFEMQKEQIYYSVRNVYFNVFLHFGKMQEIDNLLPKYQVGMTIEDICTVFQKGIACICEHVDNKKKGIDEELKDRVIRYLEEHYSDSAMSSYYASIKLGISEKKLSSIIKEETGKSFPDYLLDIRLRYAKEYLEKSDYSNEKIAELTGFSAANTFYRNFNKKVGMTPKTYREYFIR